MTKCQWDIPCSNEAKQGQYCDTHNRALGIKPEKVKKVTPIKKVSDKQKEKIKADKPRKDALSKFFAEMILAMPKNCMECGANLKPSMIINERTIIAHILEKRHFKSIEVDKDNILYLCQLCHGVYDNFNPTKMKVFELAKQRVKSLLPKIKEEEKRFLPEYYLDN